MENLPASAAPPLADGSLRVDLRRRRVTIGQTVIALRPKEFDLLVLFLRHKGKVLPKEYLVKEAWGGDRIVTSQAVSQHVKNLRAKLGSYSRRIKTVDKILPVTLSRTPDDIVSASGVSIDVPSRMFASAVNVAAGFKPKMRLLTVSLRPPLAHRWPASTSSAWFAEKTSATNIPENKQKKTMEAQPNRWPQ